MKYKTPYSYKPLQNVEKSHNYEDMTIPNESYSLRDLVKKHQQGNLPPVVRQAIWQENATHEDEDLQQVHTMDITEINELKNLNKQKQQIIEDNIKQQKEAVTENRQDRQEIQANEGNAVNRESGISSSQPVAVPPKT